MWYNFAPLKEHKKQTRKREMKNVYKKMARMVVCAATTVAIASSVLAANKTWTDANGAVWTYSTSGAGGGVSLVGSVSGSPL